MNSTKDKDSQTTKQMLISSNTRQFDLSIAYRLLIGAYIRSTGRTENGDNHETEQSSKRNSREIHRHEVDFVIENIAIVRNIPYNTGDKDING